MTLYDLAKRFQEQGRDCSPAEACREANLSDPHDLRAYINPGVLLVEHGLRREAENVSQETLPCR
jgi:hypothetical protein